MKKNILVKFDIIAGEYEHSDNWIFDKKMSEYQYCKTFWGLTEKNELKKNVFWDNWESNAIKVHSQKEITNEQAKTLNELGVA